MSSSRRRSARLINKPKQDPSKTQTTFVDLSLADSPTNQNVQSESRERPLSARKHLIPDSMVFYSPPASLRSTKRQNQIEKKAISACSKPQISRKHCYAINVFQQVDHPSTLSPEKKHEELEKIGNLVAPENLTVNIPEIEEVPEVEMSISPPSNQMEGKNTCIPSEKQFLSKDMQASNDFGGTTNKNHSKSISAGSQCPSFSLNITEMANMWDGEDDEVDCVEQNDTVGGYKVRPESMPILRKVLSKHGDIARNCVVLTMKHRSILLEMICDIISELQEKVLGEIKVDDLHDMIAIVNEIKNAEVDIEWLHVKLVKILVARQTVNQSASLKKEREINTKFIEIAGSKLEECELQKKEVGAQLRLMRDKEAVTKETLARAMEESTRIKAAIKHATSKVRRFLHSSMADGLI